MTPVKKKKCVFKLKNIRKSARNHTASLLPRLSSCSAKNVSNTSSTNGVVTALVKRASFSRPEKLIFLTTVFLNKREQSKILENEIQRNKMINRNFKMNKYKKNAINKGIVRADLQRVKEKAFPKVV